MTTKANRRLLQPPTQQTSQSSNREPNVTGIWRHRNLVCSFINVGGHHIHHCLCLHSQVALRTRLPLKTAVKYDLLSDGSINLRCPHAQNTFPASSWRAPKEDRIPAGPQRCL